MDPSIDEQQVRGMALTGARNQEIADVLGLDVNKLAARFGLVIKQARASRAMSLRKKQTAVALEGNVPMLTFLGKHDLGQNDRSDDFFDPEPPMDPKVG
jgi:hypothetical protein